MVLNGSLHEFILADILQLLSQQKTTGRLQLIADRRSGFIILQQGMVIAAEEDRESLQSKAISVLTTVKRVPEQVTADLLITSKTGLNAATAELVARQFLSQAELAALTRASIEDFTCSLFTWNTGEYRFESLENVGAYAVAGISLSADYVIMEAMRRIDETKRVRAHVTDDTIFVIARRDPPSGNYPTDVVALFATPHEYALSFVDGLSTVEMMARRMFISKFRCFEVFFAMWEQQLITPLSAKYSRSIQAALSRSRSRGSWLWIHALSAVSISILLIGCILAAGFSAKHFMAHELRGADKTTGIRVRMKLSAAELEYQARTGFPVPGRKQLVDAGLISKDERF